MEKNIVLKKIISIKRKLTMLQMSSSSDYERHKNNNNNSNSSSSGRNSRNKKKGAPFMFFTNILKKKKVLSIDEIKEMKTRTRSEPSGEWEEEKQQTFIKKIQVEGQALCVCELTKLKKGKSISWRCY